MLINCQAGELQIMVMLLISMLIADELLIWSFKLYYFEYSWRASNKQLLLLVNGE